ncbi:hypothetical protein [Actinomycetospora aeridis]|uniref:O-antigen ligase n=1 Tax=Actinomycetospora aeridis TaxID=3129231 RepID=A0ABU8N7K1_9PSEU
MVEPREARWAAVAVLAFLVPLPQQWEILSATPFGVLRWFHVGALAMGTIYLLASRRGHGIARELAPMCVAMVGVTLMCVVGAVVYGGDAAQPVQHLVYFAVGLGLATVTTTALARPEGRRVLAWCAPLAVTWTLVGFDQNLRANGVSPLAQLQQALLTGNQNALIFGVFRQGLSTVDSPAPASVRHEVMAALLLIIVVTCLASGLRRRTAVLAGLAVAAGAVVIVLSLSRAVVLAAVLGGVVVLLRAFLRMSLSRMAVVGTVAGAVVLVVVGARLVGLLYSRALDSGSYEARFSSFGLTGGEIANRVLGGGPDLAISTHTLFFDVLFRAGWVGGLCALVVVVVIARYGLAAVRRYLDTRSLPDLAAVTACSLVLLRCFTSGNGFLHQTEWAAFGVVVAVARMQRSGAADEVPGEVDALRPAPLVVGSRQGP